MKFFWTHSRRSARWLGAIFALGAASLCAPSRVDAGCDHPILARSAAQRHFEGLCEVGAIPHRPASETPADVPCHGPSCSKNPTAPLSAPVAPAPRKDECRGVFNLDLAPTTPRSYRRFESIDDRASLDDFRSTIFHPPRLRDHARLV